MNTRELLEHVFTLLIHNIYAPSINKLERALKNRFIGFRAELDMIAYRRKNNKYFLSGGYLLPLRDGKATLSAPVYFTVDHNPEHLYSPIYVHINKLNLSKLFYIQYLNIENPETWSRKDIMGIDYWFPIPKFEVKDFQKSGFVQVATNIDGLINLFTKRESRPIQKTAVSQDVKEFCIKLVETFPFCDLLDLYVSRLVFDGFIGFSCHKGIPSDIDLIVKNDAGNWAFAEIKEKDVSKTKPFGFGIDVQRLKDCLAISSYTSLPYVYVVRHVNNQIDRKFIEWRIPPTNYTLIQKLIDDRFAFHQILYCGAGAKNSSTSSPQQTTDRRVAKPICKGQLWC